MATTTGTDQRPDLLVQNLILLEYDALAAYDALIDRLENPGWRTRIEAFRDEHVAHLEGLHGFAERYGLEAPTDGDMKELLTTGKIRLGGLVGGDGALLKAMASNEDDSVHAYAQALANPHLPPEMKPLIETALTDEEHHRSWMRETAQAA